MQEINQAFVRLHLQFFNNMFVYVRLIDSQEQPISKQKTRSKHPGKTKNKIQKNHPANKTGYPRSKEKPILKNQCSENHVPESFN